MKIDAFFLFSFILLSCLSNPNFEFFISFFEFIIWLLELNDCKSLFWVISSKFKNDPFSIFFFFFAGSFHYITKSKINYLPLLFQFLMNLYPPLSISQCNKLKVYEEVSTKSVHYQNKTHLLFSTHEYQKSTKIHSNKLLQLKD